MNRPLFFDPVRLLTEGLDGLTPEQSVAETRRRQDDLATWALPPGVPKHVLANHSENVVSALAELVVEWKADPHLDGRPVEFEEFAKAKLRTKLYVLDKEQQSWRYDEHRKLDPTRTEEPPRDPVDGPAPEAPEDEYSPAAFQAALAAHPVPSHFGPLTVLYEFAKGKPIPDVGRRVAQQMGATWDPATQSRRPAASAVSRAFEDYLRDIQFIHGSMKAEDWERALQEALRLFGAEEAA